MNQAGAGSSGLAQAGGQGASADQRRSHAMQSLARHMESHFGLQVADLGGLNQNNLDFVTGSGHRLYAADLIVGYDSFFSRDEISEGKADEARIAEFLEATLDGTGRRLSAVLLWDRLQFLLPQVALALVERLRAVMEPGGLLLAMFHPESAGSAAPLDCRILGDSFVKAVPRPPLRPVERFNPRTVERLFSGFGSLKFFVTRDSLQEVLVRR